MYSISIAQVVAEEIFDREMRGAWLTTLLQIDWPENANSTIAEKKLEIVNIFNLYKEVGINTVFFQVRPVGDAFYDSKYEPLSKYFVDGTSNVNIKDFDPLAFCLEQAHKRGIELHAWINPFRMLFNPKYDDLQGYINDNALEERFVIYGNSLYLDPGFPENRKYVLNVIKDIVGKYDVDGIHLDDYFYPYPKKGAFFNDFASYIKYGALQNRDDWRRANINSFIKSCDKYLKSKDGVVFGVSPFGVWANKKDHGEGSDTNAGITSYFDSYADVKLWLEKGWIDYAIPQIYWYIGHPAANYKPIIQWWNSIDTDKHLYVGHSVYKFDENSSLKAWQSADEIEKQIELTRDLSKIKGSVFYNTSSLKANKVYVTSRIKKLYKEVALPPVLHNKSRVDCRKPKVRAFTKDNGLQIRIKVNNGARFNYGFLVAENEAGVLTREYLFTTANKTSLVHLDKSHFSNAKKLAIEIYAISKTRHVSKPAKILLDTNDKIRIIAID